MAPIRRYLRISKYSVLECRIYLDNPALAHTWLLNPRDPVLPKIIESIRPWVPAKLREERELSRNKRSSKKKGQKDVIARDDFEVSIFLTETATRHSLVTKHKHFHDTTQTKLTSNSARLISETNDAPFDVDAGAELAPVILREEEDEDEDAAVAMAAIPDIGEVAIGDTTRRPKRARSGTDSDATRDANAGAGRVIGRQGDQSEAVPDADDLGDEEEDDDLFVPSPTRDSGAPPPAKRGKLATAVGNDDDNDDDDKKALAMDISYEGFSIYGRVLCLVVKRRDKTSADQVGQGGNASAGGKGKAAKGRSRGRGQAMMEDFIISTQMPAGTEAP
ncbi:hypothetical protein GGR50DRAFT_175678 [Xylaria sp. CBS 124048]|nr:hypothetical protein GGR50DRAFT_175678 [Xylaria sp. CBS 124048]